MTKTIINCTEIPQDNKFISYYYLLLMSTLMLKFVKHLSYVKLWLQGES